MVDLSKFGENLRTLMIEHDIKAPALAKIVQTDRSNITRYQRGEQLPTIAIFVAIAEYFHISADVLLGLVDYARESTFLPLPPFAERLRFVMNETRTTQYRIEHDTGISGASMYNWLFGKSIPTMESVVRLAEYMEVSVDYLLGRTN